MKKAKVKKVDRGIVVETLARNEFEKLDDHAMYMILVEGTVTASPNLFNYLYIYV